MGDEASSGGEGGEREKARSARASSSFVSAKGKSDGTNIRKCRRCRAGKAPRSMIHCETRKESERGQVELELEGGKPRAEDEAKRLDSLGRMKRQRSSVLRNSIDVGSRREADIDRESFGT